MPKVTRKEKTGKSQKPYMVEDPEEMMNRAMAGKKMPKKSNSTKRRR